MRGSSTVPLVLPALVLALVARWVIALCYCGSLLNLMRAFPSTGALPVILPSHGPTVTVVHALEGASYVPTDPARVFIVTDERSKSQDGGTVPNLEEHASKYDQLFTDAHLHAESDKPVEIDSGASGEVVVFSKLMNAADLSSRSARKARGAAGDRVVNEELLAGDYSSPRSASIDGHTGVTVYEGGSVTQSMLGEQKVGSKSAGAGFVELGKPDSIIKEGRLFRGADDEVDSLGDKVKNLLNAKVVNAWKSLAQAGELDSSSSAQQRVVTGSTQSKNRPFQKRMNNKVTEPLLHNLRLWSKSEKKKRIKIANEVVNDMRKTIANLPFTEEQLVLMNALLEFAKQTRSIQKKFPAYIWHLKEEQKAELKNRLEGLRDNVHGYLRDNAEGFATMGIDVQDVFANVEEKIKQIKEDIMKKMAEEMAEAMRSNASSSSSTTATGNEDLSAQEIVLALIEIFSKLKAK
ncbi:hypothetical protein FA10DRAFT_262487 [Acaromyces ingoldii]|uniref:Uncharacterized protein n=1 Tax=Acaromyces ingoldii TaxID=215250 RepID=A0A316YCY0_9BASI|nr:hypothetical protein FA10DRAFT_262487 [Acaromyces ingoldii]PWN87317.1 hypothetical protein FA10DRAFT_262487 [Acaromyces ingoldii]